MKIKVLDNGVRVVTIPLKGLRAVTIEVFVKIGSKYEKKGEHGLSHFLEHMAFKGTGKRESAEMVNLEIDGKGASYNAGTSQELTTYYITTVRENIEWGLELLSDIVFNPKIKSIEVIRERGVIVEELKMYQDNPVMGLSEEFYKLMFGESPIGCWDVGGEVGEVEKYSREDIVGYRQKFLSPNRSVVVVAGDIDNDDKVEELAKKYFGGYENKAAIELPTVEIKITEGKYFEKIKQVEQGHFCVGVEGIGRNDSRRYALKLLEIIMAGNTSSMLYNEIREKRGWAYYIHSIGQSFEETGLVGVQSGVRKDRLTQAVDLTVNMMTGMNEGISEKQMDRAKSFLRGKTGLAMDRSEYWSELVGAEMLLDDRLVDLEKELIKYDKVTRQQVKELAGELFPLEKMKILVAKAS